MITVNVVNIPDNKSNTVQNERQQNQMQLVRIFPTKQVFL